MHNETVAPAARAPVGMAAAGTVLAACLGTLPARAQTDAPSAQDRTRPSAQPAELGAVSWYRDEARARAAAAASGRPVLMLFQEVPG